jgi:nitroreductase
MFAETVSQSWLQRYGESAPDSPIDASFFRHRSVRRFLDAPVPRELIASLVGAAQSAATSSNLQLWSMISVEDIQLREQVALAAADQHHVRNAPWFFAFIADHHRLKKAAKRVGEAAAGLDYAEYYTMAIIDAALAAERMVCAAESLGLGICYIGAMRNDPPKIAELLDLPENTFCPFGLCLGYPADDSSAKIKPRLPQGAVWFSDRYNRTANCDSYDDRMRAFYESEGMKGEVTWSMRSGRRVDEHHLTGREVLKTWLETQGFNRR